MLIKIRNPIEVAIELSGLSNKANAGENSITVLNNEGFSANDWVVIRAIGDEQAELKQIYQVSTSGTITLTSTLSFSHAIGTKVFSLPYNQYEISRKTTESGSFSVLATNNLEVDDEYSVYDDTGGQTSYFYRTRFLNSHSGQYSSYSSTLKGTGYSTRAVKIMIDTILSRTNDKYGKFTSRSEVLRDVNYAYQQVINKLMAASSEYFLHSLEIPTESFQHEYTLPSDFRELIDIRDSDSNLIIPISRHDSYESRGYELIGRNTLYLEDIPEPYTNSTVTPTVVFKNDAYDEDGTWVAGEDAENVTTDNDEYKTGVGSINFDIDVSDSANNLATITNSTFTAQDLDSYEDTGKWRVWMYLPDVTYLTSITMRWGSSSTVYWELTVTKDYKNHAFHDGWNLLQFDWGHEDVTETGSPVTADATSLDYIQFRIAYSSAQPDDTDFRLDGISIATTFDQNSVYEIRYLGQPSQLTNEMDEIELPEGYQYLLVDYAVAQILLRQGGRDTLANKLLTDFETKLGKFIAQSAKRTRRVIGFSSGTKRKYRIVGHDSSRIVHSDGHVTLL